MSVRTQETLIGFGKAKQTDIATANVVGGIWRLNNPRALTATPTWADLNGDLQITQLTGIALDPNNPAVAYGGSQDTGMAITRSTASQKLPG